MPNLFLQTEANPGTAFWGPSESGGGETLLLIIPIAGVGTVAAPALDPDGLRNILYVAGAGVTEITVELPAVAEDLGPIWRFTIATPDMEDDPPVDVIISAAAGNSIVNIPAAGSWSIRGGGTEPPNPNPQSATLIHDGDTSWAVFPGGGGFV